MAITKELEKQARFNECCNHHNKKLCIKGQQLTSVHPLAWELCGDCNAGRLHVASHCSIVCFFTATNKEYYTAENCNEHKLAMDTIKFTSLAEVMLGDKDSHSCWECRFSEVVFYYFHHFCFPCL